jgi:small neutral amino acid transporter SnatA (MarC family)
MGLLISIALLGLLASVSPSTIVVFILLLTTARAYLNAAAFLIGWGVSLIIVFAVSYAVGGARATQQGSGSTAVEVIEILLGVALAVLAARQWDAGTSPELTQGAPASSRPA